MSWADEFNLYDLPVDPGSDAYYEDHAAFCGVRDEIVSRLKESPWYAPDDQDLIDIVDRLADAKDADEFDEIWMCEFLDWSECNYVAVRR